jgi:hypothetical protein
MPAIEKYYKIEEVFAWQWDGNTNITAEDFPAELRNDVTGLKVERRLKTSFNDESTQLLCNYNHLQYYLLPGDFLIFEYAADKKEYQFLGVERDKCNNKKYVKCNAILFLPTQKALDTKKAIEQGATRFFLESCLALGVKVDLENKHLANCKKCGRMGVECFTTTIEEYDIYEKMLCEDCLTEMLDKKITAIKPKKIE